MWTCVAGKVIERMGTLRPATKCIHSFGHLSLSRYGEGFLHRLFPFIKRCLSFLHSRECGRFLTHNNDKNHVLRSTVSFQLFDWFATLTTLQHLTYENWIWKSVLGNASKSYHVFYVNFYAEPFLRCTTKILNVINYHYSSLEYLLCTM